MGSVKFWDLDYALKCVLGTESAVDKFRKAELVRAIGALSWFVKGLPQGVTLLEEVRSLAGRVHDGLDKPGAGYVDHPLRALKAQPELMPYFYSASLVRAGVPRAGPPQPGHVPAFSFVPEDVLPDSAGAARAARLAAAAAGEVATAAAALLGDSQDLGTQGGVPADGDADRRAVLAAAAVSAAEEAAAAAAALAAATQDSSLYTQEDEEQSGLSLFDLDKTPAVPAGQGMDAAGGVGGVDEGADGAEKVSPPAPNIDDRTPVHCDVPIGAVKDGSMYTSAGTGPLGAGRAVGRITDRLQAQAGAQTQGGGTPADRIRPRKRQVCPAIRRGDYCVDKDCQKEHPARCGDPRCFPDWRKDCPMWHVRPKSTPSQGPSQAQGNGAGAGPGRAGQLQPQGAGRQQGQQQLPQGSGPPRQQRRQGRQQPRQRLQQGNGPRGQQQQGRQQQQQQGWDLRQQQQQHRLLPSRRQQHGPQQGGPPPPLFPPLPPPPRPQHWLQAPEQPWMGPRPTYRDVAAGGVTGLLFQDSLLARLEALEKRLAGLAGPSQF